MKKADKERVTFWLLTYVINAIIIYFASTIFPSLVVLGNVNLSIFASLVITSLILTLLLTQVYPLLKALKIEEDNDLYLGLSYTVANIIGLWFLSRGAVYTGFGISSFIVSIGLGIVLSIIQYIAWKKSIKSKKK